MAKEAKPQAEAAEAAPPKKSKKLLLIVAAALVLVLCIGGAAAYFLMKGSHTQEDEDGEVAYMEINEYLRVAPLFIFTECANYIAPSTDDETPAVH